MAVRRFIPACAGNSGSGRTCTASAPVHPRVRGEQLVRRHLLRLEVGSSPRARGTAHVVGAVPPLGRFIPACAGNRRATIDAAANISVHPRVRGEQRMVLFMRTTGSGSSPRARGTGACLCRAGLVWRFIPACAGNRKTAATSSRATTVHPRVRGEQRAGRKGAGMTDGSSPRARGTDPTPATCRARSRFIPACAGNSFVVTPDEPAFAVHPRVRGEQSRKPARSCPVAGSSPRARGTGTSTFLSRGVCRFIPACAGNRCKQRRLR